jgi:hypothetical protein
MYIFNGNTHIRAAGPNCCTPTVLTLDYQQRGQLVTVLTVLVSTCILTVVKILAAGPRVFIVDYSDLLKISAYRSAAIWTL